MLSQSHSVNTSIESCYNWKKSTQCERALNARATTTVTAIDE